MSAVLAGSMWAKRFPEEQSWMPALPDPDVCAAAVATVRAHASAGERTIVLAQLGLTGVAS